MRDSFEINGRKIGRGHPVYIIAEAGVNHNGDVKLALELVRQAKRTGADCVKFQTFKAEALVTRAAPKANYQLKVTDPQESQLGMLKKLELSFESYQEIIALCRELRIQFLSTPYSFSDVDFLETVEVDAFKIASGQTVELPFLEYVARLRKPLFVSTGMTTLGEIDEAVRAIRGAGNDDLVILQCTTNYPSPIEDANILAMTSIERAMGVIVGYSDHTESSHAIYASVALGATVIEKHFTLDRNMPGPDHSSSFDPTEFAEMVRGVRATEKALGSAIKHPTKAESLNIQGMRRSLVSLCEIPAGEVISRNKLAFKRPATGLKPNMLSSVVGKKARKLIPADVPLTMDHVDW